MATRRWIPRATKPTPGSSSSRASRARTYRRALEHMASVVADDGGTQLAGDYLVGYAIEEAEGM